MAEQSNTTNPSVLLTRLRSRTVTSTYGGGNPIVDQDVVDAISEIERLRAMLERVSHLNSFRELNDILPEVRLLLGCPWSTDAERVAARSTFKEKGE